MLMDHPPLLLGPRALPLIGFVLPYLRSSFVPCSDSWALGLLFRACCRRNSVQDAGSPMSGGCPGARFRCPHHIVFSLFFAQYFPGRPSVQTFLQSLDSWMQNWTEPELPRSALKEAVKNKEDVRHPPRHPPLSHPHPTQQLSHAASICPAGHPCRCAPHQRHLGGLQGQRAPFPWLPLWALDRFPPADSSGCPGRP